MKYNSEHILVCWNELMEYVEKYFEDTQKENILSLYKHFEDRMIEAPASSRPGYHNCFVGGWLDHTLRITKTALNIKQHFIDLGVDVTSSDSDVVMAAMFHDLGKIGDLNMPYYVMQTDEWRRNKLKEWYTFNDKLEPMSVTDRSLWLLQHFDIKVSPEVWKAIKLSDGLFDDGNQKLFRSPDNRNILHYIIHFADWMSTVAEKQHHQQSLEVDEDVKQKFNNSFKKPKERELSDQNLKELGKKFDELFK